LEGSANVKPFNSNTGVRFILNRDVPYLGSGRTQPKFAFQVVQLVDRTYSQHLHAAVIQVLGPAADTQVASGSLGENSVAYPLNPAAN
jgi:hypothetical protein